MLSVLVAKANIKLDFHYMVLFNSRCPVFNPGFIYHSLPQTGKVTSKFLISLVRVYSERHFFHRILVQ